MSSTPEQMDELARRNAILTAMYNQAPSGHRPPSREPATIQTALTRLAQSPNPKVDRVFVRVLRCVNHRFARVCCLCARVKTQTTTNKVLHIIAHLCV